MLQPPLWVVELPPSHRGTEASLFPLHSAPEGGWHHCVLQCPCCDAWALIKSVSGHGFNRYPSFPEGQNSQRNKNDKFQSADPQGAHLKVLHTPLVAQMNHGLTQHYFIWSCLLYCSYHQSLFYTTEITASYRLQKAVTCFEWYVPFCCIDWCTPLQTQWAVQNSFFIQIK